MPIHLPTIHALKFFNEIRKNSIYSIIVATRPEPTVLPPSRIMVVFYVVSNNEKSLILCNNIYKVRFFSAILSNMKLKINSESYPLKYL